jgi:uncharacterized protein YlxW (UPF0749 family)
MTALSGNSGLPQAGPSADSLADILERVLDKGVVIAGDIIVNILDIELLTLKLRLLVASVDTAKAMGIDWWQDDPFLSRDARSLENENRELRARIEKLEAAQAQSQSSLEGHAAEEDAR